MERIEGKRIKGKEWRGKDRIETIGWKG